MSSIPASSTGRKNHVKEFWLRQAATVLFPAIVMSGSFLALAGCNSTANLESSAITSTVASYTPSETVSVSFSIGEVRSP